MLNRLKEVEITRMRGCYVASWDGDERACYSTVELQCRRVLFAAAAARVARALGEAGRGASPTAGKREGIFF